MDVLGISGSPRRGGNAEILLDKALEGARSGGNQTEKLVLNELKFVPCQECDGCLKTGRCIINDDMQLIYKKISRAQALILASPIFFGSLSAQLKAMIDRYQCAWQAKYVLGKKAAKTGKKGLLILVSAGDRERFFKNAESIVKNFFAVLDIEFKGNLYCPNLDEKAKALKHPDYLKQAWKLGQSFLVDRKQNQ
jgi:multimeric flavodoxin WrbA